MNKKSTVFTLCLLLLLFQQVFSQSITECSEIKADLIVSGESICSDQAAGFIRIQGAQPGIKYTAYLGDQPLGYSINSGTANGVVSISIVKPSLRIGSNVISVKAGSDQCESVLISDTAVIILNTIPDASLEITGSSICSLDPTANVIILNAEPSVTYSLWNGNLKISSVKNSNTIKGNLSVDIPANLLQLGSNVIHAKAEIEGCPPAMLYDTALVRKLLVPSYSLTIDGSTVCQGQNGWVKVVNSENGIKYQAFIGSAKVATAIGDGKDLQISIPADNLLPGNNIIKITFNVQGCNAVSITDTALVRVVPDPIINFEVSGGEFCSSEEAFVQIRNSTYGIQYVISKEDFIIGKLIGNGIDLNYNIPSEIMIKGDNYIDISATISGCKIQTLTDSVNVKILNVETPAITITDHFTLTSSQEASEYEWKHGDNVLTGKNTKSITVSEPGDYYLRIQNMDCWSEYSEPISLVVSSMISNKDKDFKFFPNPASGIIYINNKFDDNSIIKIFDLYGNLEKVIEVNQVGLLEIDISDLYGSYLFSIENDMQKLHKLIFIK